MPLPAKLHIALALSGGGVRAMAFHLGVLGRLAASDLLDQVTFISTVSGGSLAVGLVYAGAGGRWPTSQEYLTTVEPSARTCLTTSDLERDVVWRCARHLLRATRGRANFLSDSLQHLWGLRTRLPDIPEEPQWVINATTYETGKNWRFMQQRMGDYAFGYVLRPDLPLADALAASAGFPGLVGPLAVDTEDFSWVAYTGESRHATIPIQPLLKRIHLWDGGIYDNLGVEALFKTGGASALGDQTFPQRYREENNFLIVSDASARLAQQSSRRLWSRARRLVEVSADQVRALRTRSLVHHFNQFPGTGAYLTMRRDTKYIATQAGMPIEDIQRYVDQCLPSCEVDIAASMATRLWRLSPEGYSRLYRHGWEIANCTLSCYCPDHFCSVSRVSA